MRTEKTKTEEQKENASSAFSADSQDTSSATSSEEKENEATALVCGKDTDVTAEDSHFSRDTEEGDAPASPAEAENAPQEQEEAESEQAEEDYARREAEDVAEIARLFPEAGVSSLADLDNPLRFAVLRDAGLSTEEAFLATNYRRLSKIKEARTGASKAHMTSARLAANRADVGMPQAELLRAKELFEGLSDAEIGRLYRRVH